MSFERWRTSADFFVDVSHWQSEGPKSLVDWAALKTLGCVGAYVKASHGSGENSGFLGHVEGAEKAGLITGPYHWLVWTEEPTAQVARWLKAPLQPNGFRHAIDIEETGHVPTMERAGKMILEVVSRVQDATGHSPVIYSSSWYWDNHICSATKPNRALSEVVSALPCWHSQYVQVGLGTPWLVRNVPSWNSRFFAFPWRVVGAEPAAWQFAGDKQIYVPKIGGGEINVDVNLGHIATLQVPGMLSREEVESIYNVSSHSWMPQTSAATVLPEIVPSIVEDEDGER